MKLMRKSWPLLFVGVFVVVMGGCALFMLWTPDKETEPTRTARTAVEQPAAPVEPPAAPALLPRNQGPVRVMVDALPIGKSTREYYARWSADGSCSGWNADLLKVVARGLFLEDLERRQQWVLSSLWPACALCKRWKAAT